MAMIYDSSLIGKKQSVVDEILLLNPNQTPMINLLGFAAPVTQTTHQWFEDDMFADETTTSASALVGDTTVNVVDGSIFRVNDVIKIGSELLKVTAISVNALTVTRGYASTTAAAVASGAKVEFQFSEGVEGADARAARSKARVNKSNYTQIFDDAIQISGTAQAVTNYGISDLYGYEKAKKQLELALQLEKAVINGVGYQSGQIRQMKGIKNFIATNVTDAGAAAVAATTINDSLQKIFEAGGFATGGNYKIIVPAKQKRAISSFDNNKLYIVQAENTRGVKVDHFVSDFGQFEILLNNNLSSDELLVVDTNRMAIRPLNGREFFHKFLGDKGDYVTGTIVGEYTFEFMQEKAHARIKNLA
jgi:hypothetical protein